ncbi:MAG: tRNA pseudouridine(38-40) synthase TruA [Rickettsiales bacterium]|nr:tRNA pseudouridine(38-40) synthase TruA [Rickettsiales bacterium]|tara:strand:- start:328 stop:1074 length:747 start_codon:yes stop_codon:yes gene_type:complete
MPRIKLKIEYDGTNYIGWQAQRNGTSIQGEIEESLKKIFNQEIKLYVAGRTDAGVHALSQVAHFDIESLSIKTDKIFRALNFFLKKKKNKITILESKIVSKNFHSRFSVKKKYYLYQIFNRNTQSYIQENKVWFIPQKIDIERMKNASEYFLGKNDLNAFRSVDCQAKSSIRTIEGIKIKKESDFIKLRISGRSFLHNQVRIMVGTLIQVGKEILKETDIKKIIQSKNRKNAGPTAPPSGLYLEKIIY